MGDKVEWKGNFILVNRNITKMLIMSDNEASKQVTGILSTDWFSYPEMKQVSYSRTELPIHITPIDITTFHNKSGEDRLYYLAYVSNDDVMRRNNIKWIDIDKSSIREHFGEDNCIEYILFCLRARLAASLLTKEISEFNIEDQVWVDTMDAFIKRNSK